MRSRNENGFSLIELLVVIALIGMISLFALPSVTNYFKLSLNTATREIASLVKEAYNSTVMTGRVHRLVYDLAAGAFWVESGPTQVLLDTRETKEAEERRRRFRRKDAEEPPSPTFTLDKSVTRRKVSLPRGVSFEDVVTEQDHEPIKEGVAYTHFFPHGPTEQTIVHLKDEANHHISLVVSPLIGRTRLVERYVKLEEIHEKE